MTSIQEERVLAAKIERAMSSGPRHLTKDATVAEMCADGSLIVLRGRSVSGRRIVRNDDFAATEKPRIH